MKATLCKTTGNQAIENVKRWNEAVGGWLEEAAAAEMLNEVSAVMTAEMSNGGRIRSKMTIEVSILTTRALTIKEAMRLGAMEGKSGLVIEIGEAAPGTGMTMIRFIWEAKPAK